jgi:hypothetical protein
MPGGQFEDEAVRAEQRDAVDHDVERRQRRAPVRCVGESGVMSSGY